MTGPTPEMHVYTHGLLGVNPLDWGTAPGDVALTEPQLGAPGQTGGAGVQAPQLHFQLSPDEIAACGKYLRAHFDAVLSRDAPPAFDASYRPGLDQVPVEIADVVRALMPLTLAGSMSKTGTDAMYRDAWSELTDTVQRRFAELASSKAAAEMAGAKKQATEKVVAASKEAEAWIKDYLQGCTLGPDIMGDGSGATVMFANKTTPFEDVIKATVAEGQKTSLKISDDGRAMITPDTVARIMARLLVAAKPRVPSANPAKNAAADRLPNVSAQLGYTFTPETTHTTASGATTKDQPAQQLSGTLNLAFHADDKSGWEVSATGQATWFADEKGGHILTQSGLAGVQVAWVWSFLEGALTAGPLFQALAGASRAQQTLTHKLEWEPTGQVGMGGQVQYAIPGFKGHVMIGMQAGASGTIAKGAEGTVDQTAALTFTYKF